jgi:hypothetical protein
MNLKLTPAAKALVIEALEMHKEAYEAQAKDALDDGEDEAFHVFANKALEIKFVLKQVRS